MQNCYINLYVCFPNSVLKLAFAEHLLRVFGVPTGTEIFNYFCDEMVYLPFRNYSSLLISPKVSLRYFPITYMYFGRQSTVILSAQLFRICHTNYCGKYNNHNGLG